MVSPVRLNICNHRCQSVWTLPYHCRYVLRTVRHWCRSFLGPKCLRSGVALHCGIKHTVTVSPCML